MVPELYQCDSQNDVVLCDCKYCHMKVSICGPASKKRLLSVARSSPTKIDPNSFIWHVLSILRLLSITELRASETSGNWELHVRCYGNESFAHRTCHLSLPTFNNLKKQFMKSSQSDETWDWNAILSSVCAATWTRGKDPILPIVRLHNPPDHFRRCKGGGSECKLPESCISRHSIAQKRKIGKKK